MFFPNSRVHLTGALALSALAIVGCARAQNAVPAPKPAQAQTPQSVSSGWQPVTLMTAAQKADPSVQIGGEGAQWVRAIAWSRDAKLAIWGTDVGGLFRSLDSGDTWEPCNVGYTPRGTAGLAIDPNNSGRVLSVGANSVASDFHGVWLSEDGAGSWKPVLPAKISSTVDMREQLAFDPQTYDAQAKLTRVAYWSRIAKDKAKWGETDEHPALYKSEDGGRTWAEIPNTAAIGGSELKVHPTKGIVYAANETGLHRSSDGGQNWQTVMNGEVTGLDICAKTPDCVWATKADGLYGSTDAGLTWKKAEGENSLVKEGFTLRNIHVSPADANKMVMWRRENDGWNWARFYSGDGGKSWGTSKVDGSLSFLPTNARNGLFAWHPTKANVLISTGGDYPTISTDGGAVYRWTGDGVNNILAGKMQFNAGNPNLLFVSSQDYNGGSTLDGGKTWTYQNPSGESWGGNTYAGYAVSPSVMVTGHSEGWDTPRELTITRDGGKTWTKMGLPFSGPDVSMGVPGDPNLIFASNLRTADGAQTWAPMDARANSAGCDAVYTFNAQTGELWGIKGKDADAVVVASTDKGASWRIVKALPNAKDLAVDPRSGKVWAANDNLQYLEAGRGAWKKVANLPKDQWGAPKVGSVALDPSDPDVIYATANRNTFRSSAAAMRSNNGGLTWENLIRQQPLDGMNMGADTDGGNEAFWVRVNPQTREAWFVTSCYGIWKWKAPANDVRMAVAAPEKSQIALADWKKDWVGEGDITLASDAQNVRDGKSSLRVDATKTKALAARFVDVTPGTRLKVSGNIKTAGAVKLNFGVSPRDKDWKKTGEDTQIGYLQNDAKDWLAAEKTVTMPKEAAHLAITLYIEGDGKVWLDDLTIEEVDATG